jgi:hypothetical protein
MIVADKPEKELKTHYAVRVATARKPIDCEL